MFCTVHEHQLFIRFLFSLKSTNVFSFFSLLLTIIHNSESSYFSILLYTCDAFSCILATTTTKRETKLFKYNQILTLNSHIICRKQPIRTPRMISNWTQFCWFSKTYFISRYYQFGERFHVTRLTSRWIIFSEKNKSNCVLTNIHILFHEASF